ncbi:hypothetical protein ACWEU6_22000 [Streptosporangium sandarakinum]
MTRAQLIATITRCCGQGDTELLDSLPTAATGDLRDLVTYCTANHQR